MFCAIAMTKAPEVPRIHANATAEAKDDVEWPVLRYAILEALRPYRDAWDAVMTALKKLRQGDIVGEESG